MNKILAAAATLCFFVGAQAALAQEKVHTESKVKQTGPGPNVKVKSETTVGTVKEYEAGRKIKIIGPQDKTYSFDLDQDARVIGKIAPGETATVTWKKDTNGKEHVSVIRGSGAAQGAAETAKEPQPAEGNAMRMKSETTVHQPGPNARVKTEVVVGTVKEFEPGKRIKVTGPEEKDYAFNLDKGVGMKGKVVVGSRVKVEYTKGDDGVERVTVVSLVPGKAKKAT
jgi:hypothetical protein